MLKKNAVVKEAVKASSLEAAAITKPEESVRQAAIKELLRLGWREEQLQWKPEWPIPDTPHDLTKRERGQKYATCGTVDLVAFSDGSRDPAALQIVFEFKAPTIDKGRQQLIRYLSNEPMAKMGYWTNGKESIAVYKRHSAAWVEVKAAPLPQPSDDLTKAPDKPPTWLDLKEPTEAELSAVLRRIVAHVVVSDARVNRRDEQMRELLHILLVKLESDAVYSRSVNNDKAVDFRIYGDSLTHVALTAAICVISLFGVFLATRIKRVPLPSRDTPNLRSGSDGLHLEPGSPFDKRQPSPRSFADIRVVSR